VINALKHQSHVLHNGKDILSLDAKSVVPHDKQELRPGDLARYKGIYSLLAKAYEPEERIINDPTGIVKEGDMVLVLAVMPSEMFVLNKQMEIGWVVTNFFERLK
jgi:hypothetical protein